MLDIGIKQANNPTSAGEFRAEDCNAIFEELKNIITKNGFVLDGANKEQIYDAIQKMIETNVANGFGTSTTKAISQKIANDLNNEKISISDIVNNLTTGGASKVLSAEQGKTLKSEIDSKLDSKIPKGTLMGADNKINLSSSSDFKGKLSGGYVDVKKASVSEIRSGTTPTGAGDSFITPQGLAGAFNESDFMTATGKLKFNKDNFEGRLGEDHLPSDIRDYSKLSGKPGSSFNHYHCIIRVPSGTHANTYSVINNGSGGWTQKNFGSSQVSYYAYRIVLFFPYTYGKPLILGHRMTNQTGVQILIGDLNERIAGYSNLIPNSGEIAILMDSSAGINSTTDYVFEFWAGV